MRALFQPDNLGICSRFQMARQKAAAGLSPGWSISGGVLRGEMKTGKATQACSVSFAEKGC